MEELLRMEHISKRFGDFYANHDVNLSVAKGEVHTLLGENGAGKSTLMNILIGLYQPTEGSIFLNGRQVRIESPSQAVKLGIGMVHQHFMLVEAMTVFENMILGGRNSKGIFIDREARPLSFRIWISYFTPPRVLSGAVLRRDVISRGFFVPNRKNIFSAPFFHSPDAKKQRLPPGNPCLIAAPARAAVFGFAVFFTLCTQVCSIPRVLCTQNFYILTKGGCRAAASSFYRFT